MLILALGKEGNLNARKYAVRAYAGGPEDAEREANKQADDGWELTHAMVRLDHKMWMVFRKDVAEEPVGLPPKQRRG